MIPGAEQIVPAFPGPAVLLAVALAGGLGAIARVALSGLIDRLAASSFPWGTFAVNASGAFAIGILAGILPPGSDRMIWLVAAVGLLGAYTTVSSFSLQTLSLMRDGEGRRAAAYVAASLVTCLAAVAAGRGIVFLAGLVGVPEA